MSSNTVVVIGLGAMGAAVAWHLARRGVRVIGLEQFEPGHDRGSSHGESRVMRLCYYEHPDYVPLLRRGLVLWRDLNERVDRPVFHRTGGLYMGRADDELVTGTLAAARTHELPCEALTRDEIAQRFPQFRLDDDQVGVFEPEAGVLEPERIIAAHLRLAVAGGAELRTGVRALGWSSSPRGARVETDAGPIDADSAVICAGPWTADLVDGLPLTVTRQVFAWLTPRRADALRLGCLPVWGVMRAAGGLYYGFPMLPGASTVKVALHHAGPPTTPAEIDRAIHEEDEATFRPGVAHHLPDADGPVDRVVTCMYTNTPDANFIVDRVDENVFVACGFSGHGFKFCAVLGEALAARVLDGATSLPTEFLSSERFP